MDNARILLFFAALVVYALALCRFKVVPALTPLVACCLTALWFTVFGCLGILRIGGWVYYLGALGALAWLILGAVRGRAVPRLDFGFYAFLLLCAAALVVMATRQPPFHDWDEFSFWGTAAKLTTLYDQIYYTAPIGWPWAATQTPTIVMFAYPAQFFGGGFLPWQTYTAYCFIQFAAVAACCAPFGRKGQLCFPVALMALLSPYIFVHYAETPRVSDVYLTTLADIPMGLIFAGAIAGYFALRGQGIKRMWPLAPVLLALALVKDHVGLALSLVVAGIALADMLFAADSGPLKKRAGRAGLLFGLLGACAFVSYLAWKLYLALNAATAVGGELVSTEETSLFALPGMFLSDLLHPGQNAHFTAVMSGMWQLFVESRITLWGTGLTVACVCVGLCVVAAIIAREKARRRQALVYMGISVLGFAAFSLLVALSYAYIFRQDQAFASYERYMYPYYIGWFLGALVVLARAAENSRLVVGGKAAVLALAVWCCFTVNLYVLVPFSVLGFNTAEYNNFRAVGSRAQLVAEELGENDIVYLVSIHDDGYLWFRYCYELLPRQMDYSFGGGEVAERIIDDEGYPTSVQLTLAEWEEYLIEGGVTHILVEDADAHFVNTYGTLFSDGVATWEEGTLVLYSRDDSAAGLLYRPEAVFGRA